MEDHAVLIGAGGWLHKAWDGDFYPDDLPEEWRLGFYGNEFSVVLLPESYWAMGEDSVLAWLEETDDSPHFVCEWPSSLHSADEAERIFHLITILSERILGLVFVVSQLPDQLTQDYFRKLAAEFPVCLDIKNGDVETIRNAYQAMVPEQEVGVCWHGNEAQAGNLQFGKFVLTRISDALTPLQLRGVLEHCLAVSEADRSVSLIFDGAPPDMAQLVNASVMLDLL